VLIQATSLAKRVITRALYKSGTNSKLVSTLWIVSTLTINEAFVYSYRRGFSQERIHRWLALIQEMSRIELIPVSVPIAIRSAPFRHSLGLSTVDAVILATFVETGCELMVTADSDFKTARHQQVIPIELLT
jgi:predicted nucleic acid-binding protein